MSLKFISSNCENQNGLSQDSTFVLLSAQVHIDPDYVHVIVIVNKSAYWLFSKITSLEHSLNPY